jgi:GTP-binding protein HflX
VQRAALLLHISDATSPVAYEQKLQVESVLRELEVGDKSTLQVMNKIDLLAKEQRESLRDDDSTVHVSALKGSGLKELLATIDRALHDDPVLHVKLKVPIADGKTLSLLEAKAKILKRKYESELVSVELEAPESVVRRVEKYVTWKEGHERQKAPRRDSRKS